MAKRIRRKIFTINCLRCKAEVVAYTTKKKFCSNLCASTYHRLGEAPLSMRPRKAAVIKPCEYCATPVRKLGCFSYKKAYCSQEHMILHMKANSFRLTCLVCSKEFFTQPAQVKYRNRKTCSIECRGIYVQRLADERRISNPPTPAAAARQLRYSKRMDDWRKSVFARDDYTCQLCGIRGGYIEADHIKSFAKHPELRFELSNGRTLCRPCHMKTDTWGYKGGKRAYDAPQPKIA